MQELRLRYLGTGGEESEKLDSEIRVTHFPFVIGRHRRCDHYLSDPWISRRHCSFFLREGQVWLVDLGSRNGTHLNGQAVKRAQRVRDGDRISLAHLPYEVHLPVSAAATVRTTGSGGQAHNVLVVEDDVDTAETLAALLKRWGHQVHIAYDGAEAIQAAQRHHPDTVFLDLRLPRMDGYQVARRLRSEPGLENALVVAITGYEPENGGQHRQAGIDRLLTKPVDPGELERLLAPPAGASENMPTS